MTIFVLFSDQLNDKRWRSKLQDELLRMKIIHVNIEISKFFLL